MAREQVAQLLGCRADALLFTSGATEANNMVLRSFGHEFGGTRIVSTKIEHSSIKRTLEYLENMGVEVVVVGVSSDGLVDLGALEQATTPDTSLVSVQWVNNETGIIQPIEQIGRFCRERGVLFHTDAAQVPGKIPLKLRDMPVDYASFTGHKFHGPAGIGALYRRPTSRLQPLLFGGDQESELRAGTENLLGIVGIGAAAATRANCLNGAIDRLTSLRDRFERALRQQCDGVFVNGRAGRVCNSSNLRFENVDGQALVARLDQKGIRCSQSSACTNHRPEPSYVLREMGLSEGQAYESVRFGFSVLNTETEVDDVATVIAALVADIREFSAAAA
jgi:cysteine desulfurase